MRPARSLYAYGQEPLCVRARAFMCNTPISLSPAFFKCRYDDQGAFFAIRTDAVRAFPIQVCLFPIKNALSPYKNGLSPLRYAFSPSKMHFPRTSMGVPLSIQSKLQLNSPSMQDYVRLSKNPEDQNRMLRHL
jgi:hypothetical protein